MKRTLCRICCLLLLTVAVSCSLPPERPLTLDELMKTRVYSQYVIDESPEELLNALNADGEVIVEGERKIRGNKTLPVWVKILATSDGIDVSYYER